MKSSKIITPKQDRAHKSKESILAASEKIFAKHGFEGARIDLIAKEANVNKQRIYAYFGSKQKLYRQVLLKIYSQAAGDSRILELSEEDIPTLTRKILG